MRYIDTVFTVLTSISIIKTMCEVNRESKNVVSVHAIELSVKIGKIDGGMFYVIQPGRKIKLFIDVIQSFY